MIKKILFCLAVGVAGTFAVSAQEVTFSYGAYTQADAMNCHKGFSKVNNSWGAINIGLYLPVYKGMRVGPSYSYSSAYTPAEAYDFGELGTYSLKSKVGYHTLLLNIKVDYFQNSIVRLYAHAGFGAIISNMQPKYSDTYNKGYFAFQIVPVGAEIEIMPHASMFGEIGFGAQGLMQVGVKYSF